MSKKTYTEVHVWIDAFEKVFDISYDHGLTPVQNLENARRRINEADVYCAQCGTCMTQDQVFCALCDDDVASDDDCWK